MTPIERRAAELEARYPDALAPKPSPFLMRVTWAVFLLLTLINGIQTAGPDALGIPPVVFRWLGVLALTFGGIQAFLPPLKRWIQGDGRG
jgi:hypothetical protein